MGGMGGRRVIILLRFFPSFLYYHLLVRYRVYNTDFLCGGKIVIEQAAKFWYNGEKRDSSFFNDEMNLAREVITPLVRQILSTRKVSFFSPSSPYLGFSRLTPLVQIETPTRIPRFRLDS